MQKTQHSQDIISGNSHLTYPRGPRDLDDPQSPSSPSILWANVENQKHLWKTAQVWTRYTKTPEIKQCNSTTEEPTQITHTNNLTNSPRHATLTPGWSTPFLKKTLLGGVISQHTSSICKTVSITERERERRDEITEDSRKLVEIANRRETILDCADKEQTKNEEKNSQRKIRRMPNQLKQTNGKMRIYQTETWWQLKEAQRSREMRRDGEERERWRQEGKRSTETTKEPTFHVKIHSGESYLAVRAGLLEDSVMNERQNRSLKTYSMLMV